MLLYSSLAVRKKKVTKVEIAEVDEVRRLCDKLAAVEMRSSSLISGRGSTASLSSIEMPPSKLQQLRVDGCGACSEA